MKRDTRKIISETRNAIFKMPQVKHIGFTLGVEEGAWVFRVTLIDGQTLGVIIVENPK